MEVANILRELGLADSDEDPPCIPLAGGVSSGIWRVDLRRGPVCVKQALAKLRVEKDWFAPVERSDYEVAWYRTVAGIVPSAVPRILAADPARHLFVMEYLAPETHKLWKTELLAGRADPAFAAQVGGALARIHAATPNRADEFPTDAIFHSIRLEPYLEATARVHPDLAPQLTRLVEVTAGTKYALVHGDVSPKNILQGPDGPVFLDAECAWFGDPVFDLAFCLNHLLLKCLWRPADAPAYLACFDALRGAYLSGVTWEPAPTCEARAAALLPGLLLARVDGKSPVEYLTREDQKDRVRRVACPLIQDPPAHLQTIVDRFAKELPHD
jgi:tRNA A-37 threonylcarbamoyl transferase component Bud32